MSKSKEYSNLELNGNICYVTYKGKKEISREEIDGEAVLKLILHILEWNLDNLSHGIYKKNRK